MIQMMGNELNTPMTFSTMAMLMNGQSSGSVMNQKLCPPCAPSIAAASYTSFDIDDSPPSSSVEVNGIDTTMPTRISMGKAVSGRAIHCTDEESSPTCISVALTMP